MSVTTIDVCGGTVKKMTARNMTVKAIRKLAPKAVVWECNPEHNGHQVAALMAGLGHKIVACDFQYFLAIKTKVAAQRLMDMLNDFERSRSPFWRTSAGTCYQHCQ
jgi:hypothetical protein